MTSMALIWYVIMEKHMQRFVLMAVKCTLGERIIVFYLHIFLLPL